MDGLLKALFGSGFDFGKQGVMGALGSEQFTNLLNAGTSLYNGVQMGDYLDFQKSLASSAENRNQKLFDRDMEKDDLRRGAFDQASNILGF
jgi:hypothetical protein